MIVEPCSNQPLLLATAMFGAREVRLLLRRAQPQPANMSLGL